MGSELSCPCAGKTLDELDNPKPSLTDPDAVKFKAKLENEDILYNYSYGLTKINLVRTCDIEKFFNSRSLLKLKNRKEVNKLSINIYFQGNEYYDKIFISNYMGNKDILAIIMQYTQGSRNSIGNLFLFIIFLLLIQSKKTIYIIYI